jgi:SAM-dependent methyltransferase
MPRSRRELLRRLPRHTRWRLRQLGWKATALGERVSSDWLTYNPLLMWEYHEYAVRDAPAVMGVLGEMFPGARRYVDVGAGTGAFAAEAARQGREVVACERSRVGRIAATAQGVRAVPFDLESDPPAQVGSAFDIAYCFEVAEHIPAGLADRLVAFLVGLAPLVVVTAAQPGQGGAGHINEQPPEYWVGRFERSGHRFDAAASAEMADAFAARQVWAPWFVHNLLVFAQTGGG